jgi:hypothetical protein
MTTLTSTSTDPDDDIVSFEWTLDGIAAGSDQSLEVSGTRHGTRLVTLTVTDGNGANDTTTATVRVDNSPPRLVLSATPAEIVQGLASAVDVSVSDDGVDTLIARTGPEGAGAPLPLVAQSPANGSASTGSLTLPTDQLGPVSIRIEACDSAPLCVSEVVQFTVIPPTPSNHQPEVSLSGPAHVDVDDLIEVVATATDAEGDGVAYAWFVDDVAQPGDTDRVSFPSGPVGTRTVRVEVRDGHHDVPVTASTTIVVRAVGPALRASGPPSGTVDVPWPLTLDVSDPIAEAVDATIDWGDGTEESMSLSLAPPVADEPASLEVAVSTTAPTIPHTYRSDGDFVVTIEVCGSGQRCVAAAVPLTIVAPAPPSTSPTTDPPPVTSTPPTTGVPPTTPPVTPDPNASPSGVTAPAIDRPVPVSTTPSGTRVAVVPTGGLPATGTDNRRPGVVAAGLLAAGLLAMAVARVRRRHP